jgi:fumarate reductase flavoprotein subunit
VYQKSIGGFEMNVRKSVVVFGVLAAFVLAGFAACASSGGSGGAPIGNATGTASAAAPGFGGEVSVTVTLANGIITDVKVVGDAETPTVGGVALTRAPDIIKKYNSADIDTISGASVTSSAIKTAAQAAIAAVVAGQAAPAAAPAAEAEAPAAEEQPAE